MPSTRVTRRLAPLSAALGAVVALLTMAGAADAAVVPDFCVSDPTSSCPSTVAANNRVPSFALLNTALADRGSSGDAVIVEPGTYSGPASFTGPTDLTVYGDPAGARPTITSSGAAATVSGGTGAAGLKLSHLAITHTGASGPAFSGAAKAILTDSDLKSTGAGILASASASVTLTDLTVTSTAPGTTPLVSIDTTGPVTLTGLTVNAEDRATGIVVRRASTVMADRVRSRALGTTSGVGGYGMLVVGSDAGATPKPQVKLSHAELAGGSFGLAAFAANGAVDNSLLESAGATPPVATVGAKSKQPPFPASAAASGAGSTLTLTNVTAYAAGTATDGIVANGARSTAGDDPFAVASSIQVVNSIARGAAADAEVTPAGAALEHGRIALSYSSVAKIAGPGGTVVGDTTVQSDDPRFAKPIVGGAGDFRVAAGSRTLQAGTAVGAGITDLDGKPRPGPAGSAPDLGAYESSAVPDGPGTPFAPFVPPATPTPAPVVANPDSGQGTAPAPAPGLVPTPAAPSNAFGIVSKRVTKKTGSITLVVNAPAAGKVSVRATTKVQIKQRRSGRVTTKTKTVVYSTGSVKTSSPTSITLTLKASAAGRTALKASGKKVTFTVTFAPTSGKPTSITQSITAPKL